MNIKIHVTANECVFLQEFYRFSILICSFRKLVATDLNVFNAVFPFPVKIFTNLVTNKYFQIICKRLYRWYDYITGVLLKLLMIREWQLFSLQIENELYSWEKRLVIFNASKSRLVAFHHSQLDPERTPVTMYGCPIGESTIKIIGP